MKTEPVSMTPGEMVPRWTLHLYRDRNGHWFGSVERAGDKGVSCCCTATYTDAVEAVGEAVRRLPPPG
jgi:hypothetical protein